MTCREFVQFLIEYLEGALPANERAVFDHHLSECPVCVAYLQNYRHTIELSKEAFNPNDPIPEEVPDALVRAILAARSRW